MAWRMGRLDHVGDLLIVINNSRGRRKARSVVSFFWIASSYLRVTLNRHSRTTKKEEGDQRLHDNLSLASFVTIVGSDG